MHTLNKTTLYLLAVGLLALPATALAQTDIDVTQQIVADTSVESTNEIEITVDGASVDLSDDDLTVDLDAENLPTTDQASFFFETVINNIRRTFTFSAQRKADLYLEHLHKLDRKLAACAELGDSECVVKVEQRMAGLTKRAENFISKRAELRDRLLERFQAWRAIRGAKTIERRERADQLSDQHAKLREHRKANHDQARQARRLHQQKMKDQRQQNRIDRQSDRQIKRDERKNLRQDSRNDRQDTRQQNRDHLIEQRSERLDDRLNKTRTQ